MNVNILVDEAKNIVNNMLKGFCEQLIVDKQKECSALQEELILSDKELQDLQDNNNFSVTITEYDDANGTQINEETIPSKLCADGKKHFFILSKPNDASNVVYKSIDCSQEYKEELVSNVYNQYIQDNMKKKIINALVEKYTKLIDPFYQFNKVSYELREKQKLEQQQTQEEKP